MTFCRATEQRGWYWVQRILRDNFIVMSTDLILSNVDVHDGSGHTLLKGDWTASASTVIDTCVAATAVPGSVQPPNLKPTDP
jgi:hypothetical protein